MGEVEIPVREVSGDSAWKIRIRAGSQSIRNEEESPTGMLRERILRRRRVSRKKETPKETNGFNSLFVPRVD